MPQFSKSSRSKLDTCDPRLQRVAEAVIVHYDFVVLCGARGEVEQNEAFEQGKSKLKWPLSPHNKTPSLAMDLAPFPIDWRDRDRFTLFAGFVLGIARSLGVELRWGGDFNRNWTPKDEGFLDLPHFEIVGG